MTKAMPFLQKVILLSYDPRPGVGVLFHILSEGILFHNKLRKYSKCMRQETGRLLPGAYEAAAQQLLAGI